MIFIVQTKFNTCYGKHYSIWYNKWQKLPESREQYDKLQGTISNLNSHAAFKYLQHLLVKDLLDALQKSSTELHNIHIDSKVAPSYLPANKLNHRDE
jgi:hypothetical protein